MNIAPTHETIKFDFFLDVNYWDKPPHVAFYIDDICKYDADLMNGKIHISFDHTFELGTTHYVKLVRSGKTDGQWKEINGVVYDQIVSIDRVVIDGIDIRNIVYSQSYSEPIYPEPWATEQRDSGIELEKYVLGETFFGHNTTWSLKFKNPFYRFIMEWMGGGK